MLQVEISQTDLRAIAKAYLDGKGVSIKKLSDYVPGKEWAISLLKNHFNELSTRECENIKRSRSEICSEDINIFITCP